MRFLVFRIFCFVSWSANRSQYCDAFSPTESTFTSKSVPLANCHSNWTAAAYRLFYIMAIIKCVLPRQSCAVTVAPLLHSLKITLGPLAMDAKCSAVSPATLCILTSEQCSRICFKIKIDGLAQARSNKVLPALSTIWGRHPGAIKYMLLFRCQWRPLQPTGCGHRH
jgi:hypothetical protein